LGAVAFLDRRFYGGTSANWDDSLLFEQASRLSGDAERLLDLGAGAGIVRQLDFRQLRATTYGVDLDIRIRHNPLIDYACIGNAEALPYRTSTFDAVVADNVLEHLVAPDQVFMEIARVLRPGGLFHFKTPNKRHYVPTIARLTPHSVHEWVARLRGRLSADTFETHYRANTARAVLDLAAIARMKVEELRLVESRPEYCRINPILYVCGIGYERLVNSSALFEPFRVVLLGSLRKPQL
jgi:SAM-dependent methyltransferase